MTIQWKLALPALILSASLAAPAGLAQAAQQAQNKQTYALVYGDEQHMSISGHSDDWPDLKQLRRSVDGEFLWFREGGKAYIVQDPALIAKAREAYVPLERLSKQMDAYSKDMNRHGKAMDVLGKDMAHAADANRPDPARMGALQGEMRELGRQMGRLGAQMSRARDDAERQQIQAQMTRQSARMAELGAQMGEAGNAAGQRAARQDMDDIGRRMDDAGKPMHALGTQMKALGSQMKQESAAADNTVRGLIRDAVARGLARPAPQG